MLKNLKKNLNSNLIKIKDMLKYGDEEEGERENPDEGEKERSE